ncbi:MAG: glycosyltransferase [bacterium]
MRIIMFYHSLLSDWNHGNAHFLRGVATELIEQGHTVDIYEPEQSWSRQNLIADYGYEPIKRFHLAYPQLTSHIYNQERLDLQEILDGADLVIVHEWNEPELVQAIGRYRAGHRRARLLFHDTHHRSITDSEAMASYDLKEYDGVLAFGEVIRDRYLAMGWIQRAWTWHEAADTRIFYPREAGDEEQDDLVWIGNWGDEERSRELGEFLLDPVRELGLKATVYGVRYPDHILSVLKKAGMEYGGWLANFDVPEVFSRFKVTIHVPRQPYVRMLPGIPTIRPFEALACRIPLVCSPWRDGQGLFQAGRDFLMARNGRDMKKHLRDLVYDRKMANEMAGHGYQTIISGHTCLHRVQELLFICRNLGLNPEPAPSRRQPYKSRDESSVLEGTSHG